MALPPMRLSEEVVVPATKEAELSDRSVPAQVAHWAKLGMAVERVLGRELALRLKATGQSLSITDALELASSPAGQEQVAKWLEKKKVRYGADPRKRPGVVVRIDEQGRQTAGRMKNRKFVPLGPDSD